MKVSDLQKQLSYMKPDDEVVLKHLYTHPEVIMQKIRVYVQNKRVVIDGYDQEKNRQKW